MCYKSKDGLILFGQFTDQTSPMPLACRNNEGDVIKWQSLLEIIPQLPITLDLTETSPRPTRPFCILAWMFSRTLSCGGLPLLLLPRHTRLPNVLHTHQSHPSLVEFSLGIFPY